jgi:hypothetical protein
MRWPEGDDLAIVLFLASLAIPAFGFEAVKAETVPRRVIFGVMAAICLAAAVSWLPLKAEVWPLLSEWMASTARNPVSWFCVVMFFFAILAFHRSKPRVPKANQLPAQSQPTVPDVRPQVVETLVSKQPLTPSERERLSNVVYGLANVIHENGMALFTQTADVVNQRKAVTLMAFRERLVDLQNSAMSFKRELSMFVENNKYYYSDIEKIIRPQQPTDNLINEIRDYIVTVDGVTGMDSVRAETIMSVATKHIELA